MTNRQQLLFFRFIDDPDLESWATERKLDDGTVMTGSAVIEAHGKAWRVNVKPDSIGGAKAFQILSFDKPPHGGEKAVYTCFESKDTPNVHTFLYLFKFNKNFKS